MLKLKHPSTKSTHTIQTDNAFPEDKIRLRKQATEHLSELNVLDVFAGNNILWSNFDCHKYYGIEQQKGKGTNLWADNRKVLPALNLCGFNVIDLDSYGIPLTQIMQLFKNKTLQPGTVFIYTCIGNSMSTLPKPALKIFGIEEMYKEVPTLFNGYGRQYFHAYLYNIGVRKVYEIEKSTPQFEKIYGYFLYK